MGHLYPLRTRISSRPAPINRPRASAAAVALTIALVLGSPITAPAEPKSSPAPARPTVRVLKLGHQYPAAVSDVGDFRDRYCRRFATEVERRSNGTLKIEIYPDNQLVKPGDELVAFQTGALDFCPLPLNNVSKKVPELNVALLPCLLKSYAQARKWQAAPIGQTVDAIMEKNGMVALFWVWQAGAVASFRPLLTPEAMVDMRVRGVARSVDQVMAAVRAEVVSMPSSEIPAAFRDRRIDAAMTTSTSMLSFEIQKYAPVVTTCRDRSVFYFPIPFVVSKATFDSLTADQRTAVREAALAQEEFAYASVQADDEALAQAFRGAGATVTEMSEEDWLRWQLIARATAWRDFARSVKDGEALLAKALELK